MASPQLQQRDAVTLAKGYSPSVRRMELASIAVYFALMIALGYKLAPHLKDSPWLTLAAALCGYLGADFISGFVHWMADTWGRVDMPIIGPALLRPFREHHVDQKAITRHDFVETNGNNCLISIVPLIIAVALPQGHGLWFNLFWSTFTGSLVLWVFGTNQFHKWSHMDEPPKAVAILQRLHLVLPPAHHQIHHTAPYERYYCITVGWLNYPLHITRFFRILEWLVTRTTGMIPRHDDIGKNAALAVVAAEESAAARSAEADVHLLRGGDRPA